MDENEREKGSSWIEKKKMSKSERQALIRETE